MASRPRCARITCLLSIGDTQDELPAGYDNVLHKMRLLVADVVTEFGATEEDILQIVRLAEALRSETGTVLIHCEAGVSRSTAAALIMYAHWLGPGREQEAMERVLSQRPVAIPNPPDRCVTGIVRRSGTEEHELGGSQPSTAARRDSASPVRAALRRERPRLD